MPSKIFSRILRGKLLRRRRQDEGKSDKQAEQPNKQAEQEQPSNTDHLLEHTAETGSTCISISGPANSLISKLTRRFSSSKRQVGTSNSFRQRRGPHLPQEPHVESWMQPELLELRPTNPAFLERTPPLRTPLRQLSAADHQVTAVSKLFSWKTASTSGTFSPPVQCKELLFAKISNLIRWPETPVNNVVDSAGDGCNCLNESINGSISDNFEESVADSMGESLVSDCLLRLCMTSSESVAKCEQPQQAQMESSTV